MRKMKKVLSLAMTAAMTASLLTGMGAVTASAKKSDDGKRTKITALLNSTESTEQYQVYDYLLKNFCDEKGIDYEIEMVNDKQDYFTKLQMYINSDTLPDIFGCPNGTLSKACKDIDALVDLGAELDRNGYADKMNGAVRDFLTDADDGNLYLFPQGLYCEFFMYRKDLFEKAGIKETPTTWKEFEEDCQKLADIGEIPVIIGGSDVWQIMRYLSFSPWRVTGPEFITGYQAGTDSFAKNEAAKYGVNLVYDLGTKGYFEPGFASVDYTSATNLFYGGTGGIFYSGSGQINLAEDMYDAGQIGFSLCLTQKKWIIWRQIFQFTQDLVLDIIRLHMTTLCRNSLIMHVNIIQRLVTTKEIFSHRLTMIFQKDFHSFSMIFSRYLKMLKQHGPHGMISLIQKI